ncbi:hypothetical protein [Deinococcus sp. DB0503]|uniref:hypothetical protein n=1 Tax=Deinococcus sp. DB0503 TaxID=2479203 RepID=UPI0018DF9D80|nr:hypothetical protein [Deinococcus sp. DB0503]MBI0446884.1 hypothetical protein [Deinococcus sp. DB0503]
MNPTVVTSVTGHLLAQCAAPELAEKARRILNDHYGPNSCHLLPATGLERDPSGAPLPHLTTEDDLRLVDAVWCTFNPEVEGVMVLPVVTLKGLLKRGGCRASGSPWPWRRIGAGN